MTSLTTKGIKVITFDATNTLLKFKVPPWQYYAIAARDFGYTGNGNELKVQMQETFKFMHKKYPNFGLNDISWRKWWQKNVILTFKNQLPPQVDIAKLADKLIEDYTTTKCWTVAYGAPRLLQRLKEDGLTVGVISNFDPRLNSILQNVLLRQYLDFVLTSYEFGIAKPDAKIFNRALDFSKPSKSVFGQTIKKTTCAVEPCHALHIGDSINEDYKGAMDAGWNAVLIQNPSCDIGDSESEKDHVFPSIQAFYEAYEQDTIKL